MTAKIIRFPKPKPQPPAPAPASTGPIEAVATLAVALGVARDMDHAREMLAPREGVRG